MLRESPCTDETGQTVPHLLCWEIRGSHSDAIGFPRSRHSLGPKGHTTSGAQLSWRQHQRVPEQAGSSKRLRQGVSAIHIRNFEYDSGAALAYGTTGYSSTGIMIGGHGRVNRVVIDNARVANTADDLMEFSCVEDLTVRNCMLQNPVYEGLFMTNLSSFQKSYYKSRALFDKCTFIHDTGNAEVNAAKIQGMSPLGDITFSRCTFINDKYQNAAINCLADIRSLTVDKRKFIWSVDSETKTTFSAQTMSFTLCRLHRAAARERSASPTTRCTASPSCSVRRSPASQ
jgi:hypothetical protein